jgi:phospholipase/lecithinase/hemolysin
MTIEPYKKRHFSLTAISALICFGALLLSSGQAVADIKTSPIKGELYVFGDSLSDSGNAFALTAGVVPPSPPYTERFSNGPVWTEYLALILNLDVDLQTTLIEDPLAANQAVGGAFTDSRNFNDWHPQLVGTGILGQIANFEEAGGRIKPKDVVILWGGANNYLFDPIPDVEAVIGDLVQAVQDLAELGAKRIIVANLPDLGRTPLAQVDPAIAFALSAITDQHNVALAAEMAEVAEAGKSQRLKILVLDIRTAFDGLLNDPAVLPNKALPCIGPDLLPTGACDGPPGAFTPEQTVFWDPLHPTTVTHSLLAQFAAGVISSRPLVVRYRMRVAAQ